MTTQQAQLRAFFDRRHPEYNRLANHWVFLLATYAGGRDWFADNVFKYFKEGEQEFNARIQRAYRFNHTREAVDLVQKYLFKATPTRADDAPDVVKAFWKRATLSGLDIDQLMRAGTSSASIGGRVAFVVDNNLIVKPAAEGQVESAGGAARNLSVADAKAANQRIYAYVVPVTDILDYAYDEDGDGGLLWVKLRETVRDDADPINSSGLVTQRIRLWTRTDWQLYEEFEDASYLRRRRSNAAATKPVRIIDQGIHTLGRVPVRLMDHTIGDFYYAAPGLIDDIAYLDRAVANYLSNLDAIIQDQTFSQLAIPTQAMLPGSEEYNALLEFGTKRVFAYDGGQGSSAAPHYLSPDPKQAGVIMAVIGKIINEIYHTIGLAGERTKEDNSAGIDNSSGVAKAYDFERVNSLLLTKASNAQAAENDMTRLVCLWAGEQHPENDLVTYPTTFDVLRLADELATADALGKIEAPADIRRAQMEQVVDKLFPQLSADLQLKLKTSINEWMTDADPSFAPPMAMLAAKVGANSNSAEKSPATPSRQGQVPDKASDSKPAPKAK